MTHFALLVPLLFAAQDPTPTTPAAPEETRSQEGPTPQEGEGREPQGRPPTSMERQNVSQQTERDLERLEREAAQIAGAQEGAWDLEIHGYLKSSYLSSHDTTLYDHTGASGFSFDAARFWFEADVADWRLHLGYRGDSGPGLGFFANIDTPGKVRAIESTAVRELYEDVWLTIGRFRPPLVTSALLEEDKLLFYNRTFIGTDWDHYFNGAMVHGRYGQVRGWIAAQNGADLMGEDVAFTVRGMWDVFGGGAAYEREGAYGAPEDLALSVGAGFYEETSGGDIGAQAAELRMTVSGFYLAGEIVDNGEGLGDLYSWALMGSYLVLDSTEIGICLEDFDRDDSTDLYRVSLTQYVLEGDVLAQIVYANADSNAPLADSEVVLAGFTVSF
jgi:hypothetical protein